jgi:hypothetical protein
MCLDIYGAIVVIKFTIVVILFASYYNFWIYVVGILNIVLVPYSFILPIDDVIAAFNF